MCATRSTHGAHAIRSRSLADPLTRDNPRLSHHVRAGQRSVRASKGRGRTPPAAIRARISSSRLGAAPRGPLSQLRPEDSRVARATNYRQLSVVVRCVVTGPSGCGGVQVKNAHLCHLVASGRELLCGRNFVDPHKKCCTAAAQCTPKGTRVTGIVEKSQRGQRVALVVESGRPLSSAAERRRTSRRLSNEHALRA